MYSLIQRSTVLFPTWVCMTEWLLERNEPRPSHPLWWDNRELVTRRTEKDEFVARVMNHFAEQYDGPIWSNTATWGFPKMGDTFDEFQHVARNLRRLLVVTAAGVNEQGTSDEEMSDVDPQQAYTAVK